ncbi:MAG TPA: glycoside hydrolase family 2 TIM barrel-domain containing protein [Pyrinomonadaceae bacterium]|nr:glycoside hydrolase family 2 TIM barrel-domain containing protein [Pyrinomonadaceae bacterium]
MSFRFRHLALFGLLILSLTTTAVSAQSRQKIQFDSDWRFSLGDHDAAEKTDFDDGKWRRLDLPHDWSIEGPFDQKNATGPAGAFLPAGVGWYRKTFTLPLTQARRRVFIEFDGVMANSDVWINGVHLGRRPNGYVSFRYELTNHLRFGQTPNVIAVRVDNAGQPASRWYAGAGIYRHVRLTITDPVHLDHWGTFVTTPEVSAGKATVSVRSTVVNQSEAAHDVRLQITVLGPDGRTVQSVTTKPVSANSTTPFSQLLTVTNPQRWDLDHPAMYQLTVKVIVGGSVVDEETVPFGIREFRFDAATGFWLNGRNSKIKGVCLHHDGGAFGAAVPLRVWERRLELLKQLGVNAIRTAHNPPAPEFLDLTDRMGFLVMDEMFDSWTIAKNPYDYHLYFNEWSKVDTRDIVRRDRNHPSVIVYSAGNEIKDTPKAELAKTILSGLVDVFHEHDPTRPVSQGLFRPNVSRDYDNGLADILDVVGQNYRENEILAAHRQKPTRKILGTENTHDRNAWLALRDNAPYAGQFLWSGIDYLGEARAWPGIGFPFGLLDRTGNPRPRAFERQSWWSGEPMVHITRRVAPSPLAPTDPGYEPDPRRIQVLFSDWTPKNLDAHEETVEVYSNCDEVELVLNGKSLGAKTLPTDASPRVWSVRFEPGTLLAVAKSGGRVVTRNELRTAGAPARILLTADRTRVAPVWDDVVHITAKIVDKNGVLVPTANSLVSFAARGPGVVAAVDNGDNSSHESFQASQRRAYQGLSLAVIKAKASRGRITITASSPGLASGSVTITAVTHPVSPRY